MMNFGSVRASMIGSRLEAYKEVNITIYLVDSSPLINVIK
jgi:hypothetical protein